MRRQTEGLRLDVAGLLAHGSLRDTLPLHQTVDSALIDGVVLISRLDSIRRIPPRTVVIMSLEAGSSGWAISAALRHAWERKASALVVYGTEHSQAVISLAKRLEITLLATEQDPSAIAISLAGDLGAARSVLDAQISRFARALSRETTMTGVLQSISHELDGSYVAVDHSGLVLASTGSIGRDHKDVVVSIGGAGETAGATLIASVAKSKLLNEYLIHAILEVASPSVQAAWLASELAGRTNALAVGQLAEELSLETQATASHTELLRQLGWRSEQSYGAVWIESGTETHQVQRTSVIRFLWHKVAPRRPLAEVPGGWLSVLPLEGQDDLTQLEGRMRSRIGPVFSELGYTAGVSQWQPGATDFPTIVREARLAAKAAKGGGPESVLSYEHVGLNATEEFIDLPSIHLVSELALPELITARDRDQVITTVKALLDNSGSITAAAKALDVHRNTLQSRLNRARELGIPLDDPQSTLSLHLILKTLIETFNINPDDQASGER